MKNPWIILLSFIISHFSFAQSQADTEYLDVSISIFDMNLSTGKEIPGKQDIYPEVRRAEARYIPAYLQLRLMESDIWGAVRLLPSMDTGAEVSIKGKILESDGTRLVLGISATDSTGRIWINRTYTGNAVESVSLKNPALVTEPFVSVYSDIARDLAEVYTRLSTPEINIIKSLSRLRYAASLSPEIYTSYFRKNENGIYEVNHLPAENDPNFQRINEIREHEYLFIDVVDEQYYSYFVNIRPVYDLWRKYRRQQQEGEYYKLERESNEGYKFRRGSYWALREAYDEYRWAKMEEQYLDDISDRFRNEILSTDITLKDSLYRLTGALEDQYEQWKSILKEIYELEK